MWLGEFNAGDTVDFKFATRSTTGAPTQLAGSPAAACYKSNGTTESTAGITLTVDFDSRTGTNHLRVATGADGTFYADGNDFQLLLTAGTVGGTSVAGEVIGHFTLRNRAPLKPTVAGRTFDVSLAGEGGIDWANIGGTTTTVNLSGTTIKTASDVETDTNDIQTRLPAALVGGRMDANLGAISGDVGAADSLEAALDGTGGVTLTVTLGTDAIPAAAIAANAITSAKIATDAIGSAQLAASAVTEIQSGLATAANQTTIIGHVDTVEAVTDKLNTAMELDGAVYRFTTNALEQAPGGGGGGTDWTASERNQLRKALGVTGTTAVTESTGELQQIKAKTDLLGTGAVTVSGPVAANNAVTLIRGDDYLNADGRALSWSESTGAWPISGDITGATVTFNLGDGLLSVAGSVVTGTGTRVVRVELTAAQTGTLVPGDYDYEVRITRSGKIATIVQGTCHAADTEAS